MSKRRSASEEAADIAALQEALDYDPDTGVFRWKKRVARRSHAGDIAGCINRQGYVRITLFKRPYQAHRIAWVLMTGLWPAGEVDHRDGDRANNRWANLRDVPRAVNQQNRRAAQANSHSGLLGAMPDPTCQDKPWRSGIRVKRRYISLGNHETPEQAHAAYVEAKRKLHSGCTL